MPHRFRRSIKSRPEIPTASLPDIVFLLLIFFMCVTELRSATIRVRTDLPEAEALSKIDQKRLVSYVHIGPGLAGGETAIQIDDALIDDVRSIRSIMYAKLLAQPRLVISLRVDRNAQMGVVTDVQQEFRQAGTLRISYSSRREVVP